MKKFKNAQIGNVLTDFAVKDGKFCDIGKSFSDGLDLHGQKVYPGLIDIHTHGCAGDDTMDGIFEKMSDFHARHGVTAWLPTTMTASHEALLSVTSGDIENIPGAQILGFHLEGPYISEKNKGAQNPEYIKAPDTEEFLQYKNVSMVTLAPELEGSCEFIKGCACVTALGHTVADYDTAVSAIEAGAACLTHTFNAMPSIHHRNPSVIGAAADYNIYAQIICDGIHIHPSAIRLLYKLFGSDKMILISDSMRATGLSDGTYDLGGLKVSVCGNEARLSDGTLAGSVSTLFDCVKNVISFGISEAEAFKMASETPAALLDLKNKGKIKDRYDADFIILNEKNELISTYILGEKYI